MAKHFSFEPYWPLTFFLPTLSLSQVEAAMSVCLLFQEQVLLSLMEKWSLTRTFRRH